MKSVLIIDTPQTCYACPLCVARVRQDKLRYFCNIPKYEEVDVVMRSVPNAETSKPDWCPLLPLPDKQQIHTIDTEYQRAAKTGWNSCLNQIQKGNKND